ncbi:reverse transcriptase domain-containing protein [Tanacetum coccineum]
MDVDKEEEDLEIDVDDEEEEEPLPASPPPLSPLRTPPPVLESSYDYDIPVTTTTTVGRPYKGPLSTYEVGEPSSVASTSVFSARYELNQLEHDFGILGSRVQYLTRGMGTRRIEIDEAHKEAIRARQRLDRFIWEMSFVIKQYIPELMNDSTTMGDRLTLLEQDNVKNREEIQKLKNQVQSANIFATLAAMDRDRISRNLMIKIINTKYREIRTPTDLSTRLGWRLLGVARSPPTSPYPRSPVERETRTLQRAQKYPTAAPSTAINDMDVARLHTARAATAETTRAAITVGGARGSNNTGPAAGARGPNVVGPTVGAVAIDAVPEVRGCSYPEFMKCEPTKFKDDKVKYATSTLLDEALSWWNSVAQPIGIDNAYKIPWVELKKMMIKQYCPRSDVQKLEVKLWNHLVKGVDITTYNRRFQELAILCPAMVPTTEKLLERYVWGLPQPIQGNVTSFDPAIIDESMRMARRLMDQAVRA